jgi:hypothetical protein
MNPPEYYDEITRLRLRLAEVELQRDAFKAMATHVLKDLIREVLSEQTKPKMIEATWVVSEQDAERIKRRLEADPNG